MTMTEGPTGPKIGAPELLMTSAASLPARSACGIFALGAGHRVQGHWPQPRSEGELWEQLWEPQGLPYLRQEGQEGEPDAQVRRAARACPIQSLCPAPTQLGQQGCQGQSGLARSPSGLSPLLHPWPVSSLGVPAQLWLPWALCCTYSRLVFIPCEDDILFLLSVSVFMCEELLACCARARGELVPRD